MATRIAELSCAIIRLDLWIDPEWARLMVPELGHVHHCKHGREHDDIEKRVEPVPVDLVQN